MAQADTVAESSEPTEGGKQSTGRTIDCSVSGAGGPIDSAKVTVTLSVSGKEDCKATNIDTGKSLSEAVCTTDEQGRYQIKIPAALAGNPALRLAVSVEHPNCAPRSIGPLPVSDFDMHKIEDGDAYWLHRQMGRRAIKKTSLREGRRLAGRVLLPDGSPAVGASVMTRTKYKAYSWKFHSPDDYRSEDSATTDDQGQFGLMADRRATLKVNMPGQAPLVIDDLEKYVGDPPGTYRLPPGVRPHGRVLTVDGKPIPGAIVTVDRDFEQNEFDMPVGLRRFCAADENGKYELPPLPAGAYHFDIHSRIGDMSRIPEYNQAGARTERPQIPTEPLRDVFLDGITKTLDHLDESPRHDFQAVETVTVTARMEFPSGKRPDDGPRVDLTVDGRMNGKRWSGVSATADDNGVARLFVPRGAQDVSIGTWLARHRRTPNGPVEIGRGIYLGTVTSDVSGLVVIRPPLSKLKVKVRLSGEVSREVGRSKGHIGIQAWHAKMGYLEHSPDRRRISLLLAMQSGYSDYRGRALPNEELVLRVVNRVDRKETVLHEERLTLAPGEERLRTIEISDR